MIFWANSAAFSVTATGTAPLAYQWRFRGAPLLNATNSILNISSVRGQLALRAGFSPYVAAKGAMNMLTRVSPYHSVGAYRSVDVYHDRADCREGQRIVSDHLEPGTWNLPRCDQCRALDEQAPVPPTA